MGNCSGHDDDDYGGGHRSRAAQPELVNPYQGAAQGYQQQQQQQPVPCAQPHPGGGQGGGAPGIGQQPVRVPTQQPPPPLTGRKRALLIGINYPGTQAALRGCVNDVHRMQEMLHSRGWQGQEMMVLTDDRQEPAGRPTKRNIMQGLQWLARGAAPGDIMFLHYSGHGAQQPDPHQLEEDGMNETIIPEDFKQTGMISDDEIFELLVRPLPDGCRLTAVMDCCHSGTGLDLPFTWAGRGRGWRECTNPWHSLGDVVLFSGCDDDQTSADAADQYKRPAGAMTSAFCDTLQAHGQGLSFTTLMDEMNRRLRQGRFSQRPQLTSSQRFNSDQRPFDLHSICPNLNEMVGRFVRRTFQPRPSMKKSKLTDMLVGAGVIGAAGLVGFAAMNMLGSDGPDGGCGDLGGLGDVAGGCFSSFLDGGE